jgi:DNA-directed RNA polymerase specialized sigma24 family protein
MGGTGTTNNGSPESPDGPAARLPWPPSPYPHGGRGARDTAGADTSARRTLDQRYRAHYRSLVQLGALLTGDTLIAEEVAAVALAASVSDPFGLRSDHALLRLRRQVVLNSRRAMRPRRASPGRRPAQDASGREKTVTGWTTSPAVRFLGTLSTSQREAVVLRYYLDLSEHETAALMGTTVRTVRKCLASAMAAFGAVPPEGSESSPSGAAPLA